MDLDQLKAGFPDESAYRDFLKPSFGELDDVARIATADPPILLHESKASATLSGWIWFPMGPFFLGHKSAFFKDRRRP